METLGNQGLRDERTFTPISYADSWNREEPMYEMNREGSMLLTMGFTGEKAMKFKQDFIEAFDYAEKELENKEDDKTDLVRLNNENTPVTTSLKVAESFEKKHKTVVRSIKEIVEILDSQGLGGEHNFVPTSYVDIWNREKPMYEMDRNAFSQLVGSFSGEKATIFRKQYADAFDYMEEELKKKEESQYEIPGTYVEALKLATKQAEDLEQLEQKVTEDAPKVEAYDDFMDTDGKESMTESLKGLEEIKNPEYVRVQAMSWLKGFFRELDKATYQQIGKTLRKISEGLGYEIKVVPDVDYMTVKA